MVKRARKVITVLAVCMILLLALSTVVLAATYEHYFPVTIEDTSGSARENIPVLLKFAGNNFYTSGFMNATGTDTNVQQGANDAEYMMSTTQVPVFVSDLPANGLVTYNFYTGYSPVQTEFDILVGDGGYITVSDAAALELGNNFEIEQKGWLDTASGASKNLVYKLDTFRIYVSGATDVTAAITYYEYESPTAHNDVGGEWTNETRAYDENTGLYSTRAGLAFNTWSDYLELSRAALDSNGVRFYVSDTASAGTIDIDVYYSAAWNHLYEGTYTESTWEYEYIGTTESVTQCRIRFKNDDSGGVRDFYINEVDFLEPLETTATATGVSSGEHTVKATADGSDLKIYIDSSEEDSTALGGVSVLDTSNNWLLIQNEVMPYMEFYKHTVSSTLIAHYQPTVMITDTTLPDEEGAAQNGTITWGSNPGDIKITYGAMHSDAATSLTGTAVDIGYDAPTMPMPTEWFGTGDSISTLPFYDMFNSISSDIDMPVQTIYMGILLSTAIALAVFVMSVTGSALAGTGIIAIFMIIGSAATIIPVWIVFVFLAVSTGIMYLRRAVV